MSAKDLITLEGSIVVKSYFAVVQEADNLNQRIKDFEQGYMRAYQLFKELKADFEAVALTLSRLEGAFQTLSLLHS